MASDEIDLAYFKTLLEQKRVELNELLETDNTTAKPVELDQRWKG